MILKVTRLLSTPVETPSVAVITIALIEKRARGSRREILRLLRARKVRVNSGQSIRGL